MHRLKTIRPILAAAVLTLALAACQTPQRDAVSVVPPSMAFSQSGDEALPDRWWQSFNDAGLNRVMKEAMSGNLSLKATWDRLAQAEATARRAGAPLIPSLTASGGVTVTDSGGQNAPGVRNTSYSVGGAASYELDLWGKVRSTARAAALDAEASAANVRTSAISLSAQVAQTWYAIAEREARVALLKNQVKSNQQVLRLVNLRYRAGQATAPDILRQQQLLESSQGSLVQAEGDLQILVHSLAVLLGNPPSTAAAPTDSELIELPALPSTGIATDLVTRRPDLERAFLNIRAADERVSAAIAARYPSLTFSLSGQTSGAAVSDLFQNWFGTLVSQLALPLIDGGSRRADVARNKAVLSESLNNYEQAALTAFKEVEDALSQEKQQRGVLGSLQRQLKVATQVVTQLRRRFTQGASDYLDVLNAQISQQSLERQVLSARLSVIDARIELARALAGGWDLKRPQPRVAITADSR